MDEADLGNASAHFHLEAEVNRIKQSLQNKRSAEHCIDCGEPIPEARRLAAPGCERCIFCQTDFERDL